jgi:hypothetical protein
MEIVTLILLGTLAGYAGMLERRVEKLEYFRKLEQSYIKYLENKTYENGNS